MFFFYAHITKCLDLLVKSLHFWNDEKCFGMTFPKKKRTCRPC